MSTPVLLSTQARLFSPNIISWVGANNIFTYLVVSSVCVVKVLPVEDLRLDWEKIHSWISSPWKICKLTFRGFSCLFSVICSRISLQINKSIPIVYWSYVSSTLKYLFVYFFGLRWRFPPSTLRFLLYHTVILQRPRIIVGDAGFEPSISAPEVWRATNAYMYICHSMLYRISYKKILNEPPHLQNTLKYAHQSTDYSLQNVYNYVKLCKFCLVRDIC